MKGKGRINVLQCFEILLSLYQCCNLSLRNKLFEAPADPELHHIDNISSSYTFCKSNILKQRKKMLHFPKKQH